jgi:hypothetical protein
LPEQTTERRKEIFHGKESQEGRQESSQEGQVTRTRFQTCDCTGAADNRGVFFVVDGLQESADHLHSPVEPAGAEVLSCTKLMANTGSLRNKFRSLGGRGFSLGVKRLD